jgi:uncharacterized protein YbjT (DUF2867 family)
VTSARGRVALVAGASGLVGQQLVALLCKDTRYSEIHLVVRKKLVDVPERAIQHVAQFEQLDKLVLPNIDDAYCCLGTTIKVAGSRAAFRRVDYDYVLGFARCAQASGARHLAVVTAGGANARSFIFYSRIKGEVEAALATLGYERLVIMRPSMLDGERLLLAQPTRTGEGAILATMRALAPVIPRRLRAVQAAAVARAMVAQMFGDGGAVVILESERIQDYAA